MRGVKRPFGLPISLRGKRLDTTFFRFHRVKASTSSCPFAIEDNILERNTLSNVIYYFKGSGRADSSTRPTVIWRCPAVRAHIVDVHGGWYDATGDYGIHLSHQNPTSYFNPQQVPLVVWSLLRSYDMLRRAERRQLQRI